MGQNIPLGPVDQAQAVRRHWRRRLRRQAPPGLDPSLLLAGAGMALAGVGLWLTGSPTPVEVSLDQGAYTIAGARLGAQGAGVYQSEHGVVIIREDRSAASATLGNEHVTGVCDRGAGSRTEHCRFTVNGRPVAASDRRTDSGWHRTYEDGQEVDVRVEGGGPTPVPFPLGR